MAIAEPTTSAAPFAKFAGLGQKLVAAYAGKQVRQQQNYETKLPEFKKDGRPQNEEVIYAIAMPGTTAVTGDLDAPTPLIPGDEVRFAFAGYRWGQLIDAVKALPAYGGVKAGQRASGDVIEITLIGWSTATDNADAARKAGYTVEDRRIVIRDEAQRDEFVLARTRSNQPANLGKDFALTVRRPAPAEFDWETKADALYTAKPWEHNGAAPATTAAAEGATDDEEPF